MSKPQYIKQKAPIDRTKHVWVKKLNGLCKCVLCGAVTRRASYDDMHDTYEPLTEQERELCPLEPEKRVK